MENIIYWLWLSQACTPGSPTFGKLIKEFTDAKAIYDANGKSIASVIGYRTSDRTKLEDKNLDKAKEIYEFCKKYNVGIITYNDSVFPKLLRGIQDPPVLLYYRGILPDFDKIFAVAAVGTRSLTDYGRKNAFKISYDLAKAGATIVSGMAIGIDGVAMAGALATGNPTVAVIGSGIDICYPPQHLRLAREIVKKGCVLTEYAPGTKPGKINFPKRNRLISGLASATIVFEGEEKSGALITARCAKEQGRSVYALPGNIGSEKSQLSNLLIKNGAKICTRAEDVLRDFENNYPRVINLFALSHKNVIDMMATLREYEVCAVCPSDDIFYVSHHHSHTTTTHEEQGCQIVETPREPITPPNNFDKKSLLIYKRIPLSGSCSLESLVDEDNDLREVMKYLLKLEVGGFIKLLPGEMVSRKFK